MDYDDDMEDVIFGCRLESTNDLNGATDEP